MTARRMKLGAFLMAGGHHIASWRHPDAEARAGIDLPHFAAMARLAESAGFDLLFLEDAAAIRERDPEIASQAARSTTFEPLSLLAAIAPQTRRIGLVSTASTSYNEPETLARTLATLQHVSGGRGGWNLVTSASELEAANFGSSLRPPAERYARAESFIDTALGYWTAKGIERPLIVQAGASEAGRALAARTAEVVFTAAQTLDESRNGLRALKDLLPRFDRQDADLIVMPGVCPYVAETREAARAKYETLQQLIPDAVGVALLASYLSLPDLGEHSLDGPLPEMPDNTGMQSRQQLMVDLARRDGLSIRELARQFAGARGHWQVIGTPEDIADAMEERFEAGAADGFNVMAPFFPGGLEDFVQFVLPELRRRGLFAGPPDGGSLRQRLGLPTPPFARGHPA